MPYCFSTILCSWLFTTCFDIWLIVAMTFVKNFQKHIQKPCKIRIYYIWHFHISNFIFYRRKSNQFCTKCSHKCHNSYNFWLQLAHCYLCRLHISTHVSHQRMESNFLSQQSRTTWLSKCNRYVILLVQHFITRWWLP